MNYRTLGHAATHGNDVELENTPAPQGLGQPELTEYIASLQGVFAAVTASETYDEQMLLDSVRWMIGCGYKMVGVELLHPLEEEVHERARKAASDLYLDLMALDERHWHKDALVEALTAAGVGEFPARWQPYFLADPA